MCVRRLTDIRTTPLLLGSVAIMWAFIPLFDVRDESLFARVLADSGHENLWMSVMMAVGITLTISAVFKWRNMLLLSESLAIIMWLALYAVFVKHASYTPVVMVLPVFSLSCALCLLREVVFGLRVSRLKHGKIDRLVRGHSDLIDTHE